MVECYLSVNYAAAAMAHDTLKDSPNVENLKAVGKFGQALTKMATRSIQRTLPQTKRT